MNSINHPGAFAECTMLSILADIMAEEISVKIQNCKDEAERKRLQEQLEKLKNLHQGFKAGINP